jgi:aminoglycoside phosphotransferase (APT) family kinase protein
LILAALAADAAPGKNFTNYRIDSSNPSLEQLQLWDKADESFVLKSARNSTGTRELALELEGLRAITMAGKLPFEIPELVGQTRDLDGSQAVLMTLLGGDKPDLSRYTPGKFSQSMATTLAAIHTIEPAVVRDAGLPEFQGTDLIHQRVAEVDKIAATGRVAPQLLSRWEQALEDVALFRFHPTVIHGSISEESLFVSDQQVIGVGNWTGLSISDPAEDLRWLAGGALETTFEDTLLHYRAARAAADENIALRATLYSELELGSWLVYCLENESAAEVARAEDLINELRDQLDAGGLKSLRATSFAGISGTTAAPQTAPISQPTNEEELF